MRVVERWYVMWDGMGWDARGARSTRPCALVD